MYVYTGRRETRQMKKLIACVFNMVSGCVELKFSGGSMIVIDCTAVKNEVGVNVGTRVVGGKKYDGLTFRLEK